MAGDLADLVGRLRAVLPPRWFSDSSPVLTTVLQSIATPWVWVYDNIDYVISQSRLSTVNGFWLDLAVRDYLGRLMTRQPNESDAALRSRLKQNLMGEGATRPAIAAALRSLTGTSPVIFEPANCGDTGGYGGPIAAGTIPGGGLAYGAAGGWGSIALPYQFFVSVRRPTTSEGGMLAGYGTPAGAYGSGSIAYFDLAQAPGQVTDDAIRSTILPRLPASATAWLRIV